MRISDVLLHLIGVRDPNCPNEADVLAYSKNKLSTLRRVQIERHFADCDDCRQVLAFLVRESAEATAPVTEEAVSAQTNRILAYIQNDERKRTRSEKRDRAPAGFYVSYPRLASVGLVISAIAVGAVLMFTGGQSPAGAAMDALKVAVKDRRQTEARVSRLDYSRYAGTIRGNDTNHDDLLFGNAENKVKAETSVEGRLMLARVCLARGSREDAKRALDILDQLTRSGVETAEALNDTGVAHLQLENYPEAINYFSKALAKSPAYGEALFNRALAEGLDRRNEDARRDWQAFIEQSSDDNWKKEARDRLDRLNGAIR